MTATPPPPPETLSRAALGQANFLLGTGTTRPEDPAVAGHHVNVVPRTSSRDLQGVMGLSVSAVDLILREVFTEPDT